MAILDSLAYVSDYVAWGKLLKRWAKDEPGAPPIPRTPAELISVCKDYGVTFKIPDYITKVEIVRRDKDDTLTIMLPSKALLEVVEKGLKSEAYPIADFYTSSWTWNFYPPALADSYDVKMMFHEGRIGEYTISQCC